MSNLEISVTGSLPSPQIEMTPAAFEARRAVLATAKGVISIESVTDLDVAASALTQLASIVRSVESSRKDVKGPVLDVGKRIDAVAKLYVEPLEAEKRRLEGIVGTYQEAQRRKAERVRQEAAAAEAAALAEMQAKEAALAEAGKATPEAVDAVRAEAADKIAEAQLTSVNAAGPQVEGITTKTAMKFEVVDIKALFAACPDLCIIEPNNAAIRAVIKTRRDIPGLRIWSEAAAIVRGTKPVELAKFDY